MTPEEMLREVLGEIEQDALVTKGHFDGALEEALPTFTRLLLDQMGAAWDRGWDSGHSEGEWGHSHKPMNPFTFEMNDDRYVYCSEHGGEATVEMCEHESHPIPEPPACTCGVGYAHYYIGGHHLEGCLMRAVITLPEIKVARGGIKFHTGEQPR